MEFLAEDNICGQHLLKLAARGSAVIAELLRLSSNIPDIFTGDNLSKDPERKKHIEILFNYQYLHDPEEHENNLSKNADLLDLDQEVQESHSEILDRLYKLFESIWKYQADFAKYIDDVQNGFYIQHSLDDIFMEVAGKQLMCEALYLYGTMLLLLEERIPGAVREKIMIAAYRYRGEGLLSNIDEVCRLCRSTGYIPGQGLKRPKNHPASFFSRFAPNADYVRLVIGCLQTDDIYNMATSFPNPDHRSTRLAQQASILFTILFFAPDVLNNQYAIMREFVDKYFNDNWIISTYMGYVVDLSIEWASYPAARTALQNTITVSFVRELDLRNEVLMNKCIEELKDFLTEGVLQEDYFLDNVNSLMKCVRACNVALRWRLMHRRCQNQTYNKIIHERVSAHTLVTLLLNTSQLEFILKELLLQLLANKNSTWENCQNTAANSLTELSEYFVGDKALSKVKKDEKLMNWFSGLSAQTRSLDLEEDHATSTGRRIQGLIAALEDVEQYESIDTNIQIKSFLSDVRKIFRQMIRTVNVKDELINNLENISDFSYAWESLGGYLNVFHERIHADSSTVVLLRATFLKTASVLDVPLIRITAIESPDAVSVAEYYSSELVEFVRLVLGVIPVSVFSIMSKIESIQAQKMVLVPSRLEAKDLKDFAQLDVRYELSKLTHQAAVFTEGVLVMEKTLLGVIQVEPRAILEEGLRRELVQQIATAMHESVIFEEISRAVINAKMSQLASTLDGLERSIEYLQDYIGISGLKMYNEEMSRVINYNVEQEANRFLKKKIFNGHSRFQSRFIPVPQFPLISSPDPTFSSSFSSSSTSSSHVSKKLSALFLKEMSSMNFMGRIMNSLLFLTHPAICVYAPEHSSWYQCVRSGDNKKKSKNNDQPVECCGVRTFALLERSLGAVGLRGLDRLFAFSTVFELNSFIKFYEAEVTKHKPFLDQMRETLFPENRIVASTSKLYIAGAAQLEEIMAPILKTLTRIGQNQLLRKQISCSLQLGCQLDGQMLHQSLDTFNTALVNDVLKHYRKPGDHPYPDSMCTGASTDSYNNDNNTRRNSLLVETSTLLEACGLDDSFKKIYMISQPLEGLPVLLMFFLFTQLQKVEFNSDYGSLVSKKSSDSIDGIPLVCGISCLLRQMHVSVTYKLMSYLGQYVRSKVHQILSENDSGEGWDDGLQIPELVANILIFLEQLCRFSTIPRSVAYAYVPPYIFDSYNIPNMKDKQAPAT